jgi:hypothetical protein
MIVLFKFKTTNVTKQCLIDWSLVFGDAWRIGDWSSQTTQMRTVSPNHFSGSMFNGTTAIIIGFLKSK